MQYFSRENMPAPRLIAGGATAIPVPGQIQDRDQAVQHLGLPAACAFPGWILGVAGKPVPSLLEEPDDPTDQKGPGSARDRLPGALARGGEEPAFASPSATINTL